MTENLPKVLDRLRKLLAVSRSAGGNEHERAAAAETARKLMSQHALTEDDVKADAVVERPVPGHKFPIWRLTVLFACAKCCACLLVRRKLGPTSNCKVVGRQARVDETLYMYLALNNTVKDEAERYPFRGEHAVDSFKRGMATSIKDRLAAADFARREPDKKVEEYLAHQHGGAAYMKAPPGAGSPGAFADGYQAGMNLNIPNPKAPSESRLITPAPGARP